MPVHGKDGKDDTTVFPTLPTDLGNRCGDSHITTAAIAIMYLMPGERGKLAISATLHASHHRVRLG